MEVRGENELAFKLYGCNYIGDEGASLYLCKTDSTGALLEDLTLFPDASTFYFGHGKTNETIWQNPYGDTLLAKINAPDTGTKIYAYNEANELHTLLTTWENENARALCSIDMETLYFFSNGYINQYHLPSETMEHLCNINDIGISMHFSCQLLINAEGQLAFASLDGEHPGIFVLTDEDIAVSDAIQMTVLTPYGAEYISNLGNFFSYESGHMFQVEQEYNEQYQEAFRDRTMIEITQGGGPELLWVSEADMRILAEKEALMDISAYIPTKVKNQLLPGVIQAGTVNNNLVGISPWISFETMTVSNSVWKEDSWEPSDLLDIIESRQDLETLIGYNGFSANNLTIFLKILCKDLQNSDYLDMDQGISYFNREEFLRVLEFCKNDKQTPRNDSLETNELYESLRNGTAIAKTNYLYEGMQDFSSVMRMNGEDCHIVGYPTKSGNGNYISCDGYLVVNANATHIDEIKGFLGYILDYDNQYICSRTPVRKDVIRDRLIFDSTNQKYAVSYSTNNLCFTHINCKPDGSTYLEEFMAFAESCVPKPYVDEAIMTIIYEEIPALYSGAKTKEQVADTIHRRVQLYLDENH